MSLRSTFPQIKSRQTLRCRGLLAEEVKQARLNQRTRQSRRARAQARIYADVMERAFEIVYREATKALTEGRRPSA